MDASIHIEAKTVKNIILFSLKLVFLSLSLLYLVRFIDSSIDFTNIGWIDPKLAFACIAAGGVFATTALFSALAWREILVNLRSTRGVLAVAKVFCITQIGKYLPGNVGHHIGRIALARSALGISPHTTIISILQESGLACLAAISLGLICVWLTPTLLPPIDLPGVAMIQPEWLLLLFIISALLIIAIASIWRSRRAEPKFLIGLWAYRAAPTWKTTVRAGPIYLAIYLTNGLAIWLIASALQHSSSADLVVFCGAYALSWTLGFLIPGPPGGLGVREAAMTAILSSTYPPDFALLISLLSRLSSLTADLFIFLTGAFILQSKALP